MSKITLLGTCSGTEPIPNMHHCSILFDINDSLYWFDCGEGAVYNAFTAGTDIMHTRAVFISHMHFDHVGGLSHLLFTVQKMMSKHKMKLSHGNSIKFHLPDTSLFEAFKTIADCSPSHPFCYETELESVKDGVVYSDENLTVTAHHNTHLKENGDNGWHSFSYLINTCGKRIVFSGDVSSPQELDLLIGNGCDLLIMETGHHKVNDVLRYVQSKNVDKLYFNHHGREILASFSAAQEKISLSPQDAVLATDGTVIEL